MKALSSIELKAGATTDNHEYRPVTQPLQFLPKDKKDLSWAKQNADWFEELGIRQVKQNGKRLLKNIRLAKGIIEKSDYMVGEENEYSDVIERLIDQDIDESALDLKFFPIIPNVVNILKAEFSKRSSKIMFVGKDHASHNELLEEKRSRIEQALLATESQKMMEVLIQAGMDPNSEEFQQQMSSENIKTLPQIQQFFNKDYQSLIAEWATHQKKYDDHRFNMRELEIMAFESSITCDREYWHFVMGENDYQLELMDPVYTWIVKSQNTEYASNANAGGDFEFMTAPDILDKFGYLMTDEQIQSMETVSGNRGNDNYTMTGVQNDGSMYDASKSHDWNTTGPSLGMRQFQSFHNDFLSNNDGIDELFNTSDLSFDKKNCFRVSRIYWKTQRKLYQWSKKTEDGQYFTKIVDEDIKITDKPIYNTVLFKEKSVDSLIMGEHLEPLWTNQTWGAIKIGRGTRASSRTSSYDFNPIYLGIDRKEPGPLKFQFKGDDSIWGCKIPIEGRVFSGKNTRSICPVDLMKPAQINYNIVNNQISDILIDEIGPVAMIDQNMLPKHSLGEDWGPGNYVRAAEAMKRHKLLPMDGSTRNMEGTTNFNQTGMLNFDETNRLMSRISLSRHFKEQAMEVIGITPQRVGQIQASETAAGTETAVTNSYAQTEMLFIQHCDWLMPRVHTMRTDLAQYYHSKNPSLRLQYVTEMDEKVNFQMNTIGMLARELGVFCTTDINSREILKQMKQFFISTNSSGGNMHDLSMVLKADSLAEMDHAAKAAEKKVNAAREAEYAQQDKLEQQRIAAEQAEKDAERAFLAEQNQLNRDNDIQEQLIRAAGMPTGDGNADGEDDYLARLDYMQKNVNFQQKLNLDREKEVNKTNADLRKENLKREEMRMKENISNKQLQIARENKNKYDRPTKKK